MRVVVDLTRCQGYAQCAFHAPSVFRMHGEEALMYNLNPDDATRFMRRRPPTNRRRWRPSTQRQTH